MICWFGFVIACLEFLRSKSANGSIADEAAADDGTVESLTNIKFRRCSGVGVEEMRRLGKLACLSENTVRPPTFSFFTCRTMLLCRTLVAIDSSSLPLRNPARTFCSLSYVL